MFDTTTVIEALGLGMLFGAIAGAVGAAVFVEARLARRRRKDRERLVRMQRYLSDAQGPARELRVAGYSRAVVTFDPEALAADPPYSAAGGSYGVRPQPTLTLVDGELSTPEVNR